MSKSFQIQSVFVWKLLAQTGTDLSTQNCYKPVETALLQLDVHNNLSTSCSNKHGTACCHQSWYKLFQQLATGLQANNLSTSCWRQLATTCWLNKLVATCSTSCYKLVKPTTCWQDVRFYVCNVLPILPAMLLSLLTQGSAADRPKPWKWTPCISINYN